MATPRTGVDPDLYVSADQPACDIDAAADLIAQRGLCRRDFYDPATHAVCPLGALSEVTGDGTGVLYVAGTADRYIAGSDLIDTWMSDHQLPRIVDWVDRECTDAAEAVALLHEIAAADRLVRGAAPGEAATAPR